MKERTEIKRRVYLAYGLMVFFAFAIVGQVANIQFVEGEEWKGKAQTQTTRFETIEATRGNIFAEDGSLLATSKPIYEVRWDAAVESISDELFNDSVGALAAGLSRIFNDRSRESWKRELIQARNSGNRYHLIKRNIEHAELKRLKLLPLFNKGRFKSGIIIIQKSRRAKPFRELASRTIGYDRPGYRVGLEGAYTEELGGVNGKRLMQKISGGVWKPLADANEIEPQDGMDLVTSIDINIQDVAESALETQLRKSGAQSGCVVLMEVQTGLIKAIANLTLQEDGSYRETYNYALGASTEPGSTFKLASIICLLEDGHIALTDTVDIEGGILKFYDRTMRDSKTGLYDRITIAKAFEVSSNVGISKLVDQHYRKNPTAFVNRIRRMKLDQPLGTEIPGEGKPFIKNPKDASWSGVSLPWMSIGYESLMTPLQMLTFYNAIANDGKMVKPRFVKAIKKHGRVQKEFTTEVIEGSICSRSTLTAVRGLLEDVVERGTATNLRHAAYRIAGKTGTAQVASGAAGYKKGKVTYQASFVGYFPAENPRYSCMVVVNDPGRSVYYGNLVAGPVFKEISDKVYSTQLKMHPTLVTDTAMLASRAPSAKATRNADLQKALSKVGLSTVVTAPDAEWAVAQSKRDTVLLVERQVQENIIPRVIGMGAMDALYLLENLGLEVRMVGSGVVRRQSITAGTRATKGREIIIELS
jgi:cell division protein FtsI (penicillin-binding protein 3)